METKLDSLIEKIKTEGVQEAQNKANVITSQAKQDAKTIIENAKQQATGIIEEAKAKAEQFKTNADNALRQAVRDTILLVREELTSLFGRLLNRRVIESLNPEFLQKILLNLVGAWKEKKNGELEIIVNAEDKEKLKELLLGEIQQEVTSTITLTVNDSLTKGFRIGIKGSNVYYDFSDESITEILQLFVGEQLSALMEETGQNNG